MKNFSLSPYSITFLFAFVMGFAVVYVLLRKKQVPRNVIGYLLGLALATTLFGSKFYGVITSGFTKTIFQTGTASLGGVIGLLTAVFLMGKIYPAGKPYFLQAASLAIPLMYGIAKIGCHFAGCCGGIAYYGPFARKYPVESVSDQMVISLVEYSVFPVQLLETIVFALIFLFCLWFYFRISERHAVSLVMILCGLAKALLEFLREEHVGKLFSVSQMVCAAFVLWGVIRILKQRKSSPLETDASRG